MYVQCGDVKANRLSLQMVERYLDKHVLVFNRDLLKDLFTEADYRNEGSLDVRALKAALSGVWHLGPGALSVLWAHGSWRIEQEGTAVEHSSAELTSRRAIPKAATSQ